MRSKLAYRLLALALVLSFSFMAGGCGPTAPAPEPTAVAEATSVPTSAPEATTAPEPTEVPEPTAAPPEPTAAERSERQGTLITPYFDDMQMVDPDVWYDIEGGSLMLNVYEGLIRYAADSVDFEPLLAERWEVSEDDTTYTFYLRQGVKFHDGTPFNAEAVKFNFERRLAVNQGPAYMLFDVESTEPLDEYTVQVKLKQPVAPFLHFLASMWGPKMISPTAVQEHQQNEDWAQDWLREHAVGTGPYQLESFERGSRYTLVKFDDYWRGWEGSGHFDQVLIPIVKESATQRLLLEGGDADLLTHGIPPTDLASLISNPQLTVERRPINQVAYIHLNTQRGPTADPYVREALAWAWNYQALLDMSEGYVTAWPSVYMQGMEGYNEVKLPYSYDLERAREALAKSQYPDGGFTLEMTVLESEVEYGVKMAQVFQSDLQKLNITLDIRTIPISVWWDLFADPQQHAHVHWDSAAADASDSYTWAYIVWHTNGFLNASFYSNPEVDQLLDAVPYEPDAAKRLAMYEQLGDVIIRDNPAIFAGQLQDVMVMSSDLTGFWHTQAYPYVVDFHALTRTVQ